jgi:hypothetical protein
MKLLALLLLLIPIYGRALEIDEKLTVRIINISETKKTIMVNRGTEDGLVEGDHAKFIVTAGIVARAVCIRVSPSRSVWAVYRLVNADFIVNDSVMTLKISPPVKITRDESQALVQDDTPSRTTMGATPLGVPLADGADDLEGERLSRDELRNIEESRLPTSIPERSVELVGQVHVSGLTALSSPATGGNQYASSHAYHNIGLGAEFYPQREREWYSRFSLLTFLNIMRENAQAYNGASVSNDTTEVAVGLNWHPFTRPSLTMQFIPFFHASMSFGSHRSQVSQGGLDPLADPVNSHGRSNGFAIGFGYKFYTHRGFGVRALVDYYRRVEAYGVNDTSIEGTNRTVSGPRLMLALSYRF